MLRLLRWRKDRYTNINILDILIIVKKIWENYSALWKIMEIIYRKYMFSLSFVKAFSNLLWQLLECLIYEYQNCSPPTPIYLALRSLNRKLPSFFSSLKFIEVPRCDWWENTGKLLFWFTCIEKLSQVLFLLWKLQNYWFCFVSNSFWISGMLHRNIKLTNI